LPAGKQRTVAGVSVDQETARSERDTTTTVPAGAVEREVGSRIGAEPHPRRWLIFGIVSLALLMASIDQTIVAIALPALQSDLHAQVNWSSWTITIYALGQILVMPLAGRFGDRYGRKRVFVAAAVLFTVASLCCGLANDIYLLVALRAVQAIGGGAFMPSATGIVSEQFGRNRDRALGLFASVFPIGGIVGPVLGGVVLTYWSWRGIFLVNVPIGVLLIVTASLLIPGGEQRTQGRLDGVGVLLVGTTLLPAMFGIAYLGSGSASPVSVAFILPELVAAVSLVLFVRHARRAPAPFIPARLLIGRGFGVMNLLNFLYGCAALGFGALVPLYAEQRYGIPSLQAGTLLTARAVGMIGTAAVAVMLLRRTGHRRPMILGYVLLIVGMLGLASAPPGDTSPFLWLAAAAAVAGIGTGTATPASNNAGMSLAPDQAAAIAGLRGMFRQTGGITAISVTSAILARSADPGMAQAYVFVAFAVILAAAVPLIFRVPDQHGRW
jgi:EmrB/QacA subfamily drug resistance transporter